jgi:hypothetical protein
LIAAYEQSGFKAKKGFKTGWPLAAGCLGIYPRHVVEEVGGWRYYDKHEDVDFLTRLFMYDRVIYVPIVIEENEPSPYKREKDSVKADIGIIDRYSRYAKGLRLVQKALWHKFNLYCACNYTLRKLVLRNRHRGIKLPVTSLAAIFLIFTKLINHALRLPIAAADPYLINFDYIYYMSLKTMIYPSKLGLTKATNIHQFLYKDAISFIAQFKPDIIDDVYQIKRGLS